MPLVRRGYDRDYFDSRIHRADGSSVRMENRMNQILRQKSSGRLLEIGPGTGSLLRRAADYFEVEGIEVADSAVEMIGEELRGSVQVGDIQTVALPTRHYDVVVAFNVLEHLTDPAAAVGKIRQSLRQGGSLVGSVPLNASAVGRIHTALTNVFDRTHVSTLAPEQWQAIFLEAGFGKVWFFGEIMFGPNWNVYVEQPVWRHVAFNLVFACQVDG